MKIGISLPDVRFFSALALVAVVVVVVFDALFLSLLFWLCH